MTASTDTAEFIRREYGVPAEVGRRVVFSGYGGDGRAWPGVITAIPDHHLRVRLDGARDSLVLHPTSKLQYLDEVVDVPPLPMGPFVPDGSELEEIYYGVPVASFEDGTYLALTTNRRRALAALNAYARDFQGFKNLARNKDARADEFLAALRPRWVVFEWQPEGSEYQWFARHTKEDAACAVPCLEVTP